MEKHISQLLPRAGRPNTDTATFDATQVSLTDAEKEQALADALRVKVAREKELAYWARVNGKTAPAKYTADELYHWLKITKTNGGEFVVDEQNEAIVKLLCLYFAGDEAFEQQGYSLSKGIMLLGPVGCGKTTLMRLFRHNQVNSYVEVSCRRVADDYAQKDNGGSVAIKHYSSLLVNQPVDMFGDTTRGMFYDDLGTEEVKKHFGNEVNCMAEILLNRYDNPELQGRTHLTTNLSADEIEAVYGTRVRSRIRGMFNVLKFDKSANDRRK
jgi:DNA replication protein DnaC